MDALRTGRSLTGDGPESMFTDVAVHGPYFGITEQTFLLPLPFRSCGPGAGLWTPLRGRNGFDGVAQVEAACRGVRNLVKHRKNHNKCQQQQALRSRRVTAARAVRSGYCQGSWFGRVTTWIVLTRRVG